MMRCSLGIAAKVFLRSHALHARYFKEAQQQASNMLTNSALVQNTQIMTLAVAWFPMRAGLVNRGETPKSTLFAEILQGCKGFDEIVSASHQQRVGLQANANTRCVIECKVTPTPKLTADADKMTDVPRTRNGRSERAAPNDLEHI